MAEHDPKNALLNELESIKGLLDEQDTEPLPGLDQIPVLREVIESIEPLPEDRPHQPPLFPEANTKPPRSGRPVQAKGENPFLPPHIRARLQGNQPTPHWTEATEQTETEQTETATRPAAGAGQQSDNRPTPESANARSELIEALVDECRPLLETRLRARLEAMTDEQLAALRS